MAITETGVVVTTLQGIQGIYTESGEALQIVMDGLTPNTAYRATAYCIENGIQSTSNTEAFTTLQAGTITLTHQSNTRQGSNYIVTYTYTSTYALSSSILRCGSTITSQGVIAGNTITYTVSGLVPGDAYMYDITTIDIYTESSSTMGTLVMPVVNTVEITDTTPTQTSVECDLSYTLDGGFTSGIVEYWNNSDDPATDQPQGHSYFNNGESTCTITGLTAGTTYKFRATILLGDQTTEITSTVVSESTLVNVINEYLTITNIGENAGNVRVDRVLGNTSSGGTLQYSFDKSNWTSYYGYGSTTVSVRAGESVYFRGNFTNGFCNENNRFKFTFWFNASVSGNPFSLRNYNPATFSTYTSTLDYEFANLFQSESRLKDISGLATGQITTAGYSAFLNTFNGTGITQCPDFSGLTEANQYAFQYAFANTGITSGANLSRVTVVYPNAFNYMYHYSSSLREATTPNVQAWYTDRYKDWLMGVAASGVLHKPSGLTIPTEASGVPSGWTTQDY